jgi:hypothetical protein
MPAHIHKGQPVGANVRDSFNPDELAAVPRALRDTIAADRYPLSRRIRSLKAAAQRQ